MGRWLLSRDPPTPLSRDGGCLQSPGLTASCLNSFLVNMLPFNLPEDFFLPPTDMYLWLSNGSQMEQGLVLQPFCLWPPYPHKKETVLVRFSVQEGGMNSKGFSLIFWSSAPHVPDRHNVFPYHSPEQCPQTSSASRNLLSSFQAIIINMPPGKVPSGR